MTNLSPATQAVLDAAIDELDYVPRRHVLWAVKAAIRALADQVVPEPNAVDKGLISLAAIRTRCRTRDAILAIATELEGTND